MKHTRGRIFSLLYLKAKAKKLKISSNVEIWGEIEFGNNIFIGSGVKIYLNTILDNNVYLGDNVEIRGVSKTKITIGKNTTVNRGSIIIGEVLIGNDCLIAPLCVISGSNHDFSELNININKQGAIFKGITLKDNVWLGAHVTVLDGVTIGKNSVIGAGSVVTKNIPKNSIAVGNPCQVIKTR